MRTLYFCPVYGRPMEYGRPLYFHDVICCSLWSPYVIGQTIIFSWFLSSSIYLFCSSPNLSRRRLYVYHTSTQWRGLSANLECRSETAARDSLKTQDAKSRQKSPAGHHRTTLSGYIFATKARIDNRKKFHK